MVTASSCGTSPARAAHAATSQHAAAARTDRVASRLMTRKCRVTASASNAPSITSGARRRLRNSPSSAARRSRCAACQRARSDGRHHNARRWPLSGSITSAMPVPDPSPNSCGCHSTTGTTSWSARLSSTRATSSSGRWKSETRNSSERWRARCRCAASSPCAERPASASARSDAASAMPPPRARVCGSSSSARTASSQPTKPKLSPLRQADHDRLSTKSASTSSLRWAPSKPIDADRSATTATGNRHALAVHAHQPLAERIAQARVQVEPAHVGHVDQRRMARGTPSRCGRAGCGARRASGRAPRPRRDSAARGSRAPRASQGAATAARMPAIRRGEMSWRCISCTGW